MMMRSGMTGMLLVAAAVGCDPEREVIPDSEVAGTIAEKRAAYVSQMNSEWFFEAFDLYGREALIVAPRGPILPDRVAFVDWWSRRGGAGADVQLTLFEEHVAVAPAFAVERARYEVVFLTPGGEVVGVDNGMYVAEWSETAQGWMVDSELWSSQGARAGPAATAVSTTH